MAKNSKLGGYFFLLILVLIIAGVVGLAGKSLLQTPVGKVHFIQNANSFSDLYLVVGGESYRFNKKESETLLKETLVMQGNMLTGMFGGNYVEKCALDFKSARTGLTFRVTLMLGPPPKALAKIDKFFPGGGFYYDGQYNADNLAGTLNKMTKNFCA